MPKVKIEQERYEALLDNETRVAVLLNMERADGYVSLQNMFRILGNELEARKIQERIEGVVQDDTEKN